MARHHLIFGSVLALQIVPPASATTFQRLHVFKADTGQYPVGALVRDSAGALYGLTTGTTAGTVFQLTPPAAKGTQWQFTVLHVFPRVSNAPSIFSGLAIDPAGTLFGTTAGGLFRLTPPAAGQRTWAYKDLYKFGAADGAAHYASSAPLLGADGALYGTTENGGAGGRGAIYRLAPSGGGWVETILHSFTGADGAVAKGDLATDGTGALFGTTQSGGTGRGNVYRLVPPASGGADWRLDSLWNMPRYNGYGPVSGVAVGAGGVLFGTYTKFKRDGFGGHRQVGQIFAVTPPVASGGPWTGADIAACSNYAVKPLPADNGSLVVPGAGLVCALTPPAGSDRWATSNLRRFAPGTLTGPLLAASGGVVYGVTQYGKPGENGSVFSISP